MIPRLIDTPAPAPLYGEFLTELRALGFEGDLSAAYADRTVLATDNSIYQLTPQAVAFPRNADDLVRIARLLEDPRFGGVTRPYAIPNAARPSSKGSKRNWPALRFPPRSSPVAAISRAFMSSAAPSATSVPTCRSGTANFGSFASRRSTCCAASAPTCRSNARWRRSRPGPSWPMSAR